MKRIIHRRPQDNDDSSDDSIFPVEHHCYSVTDKDTPFRTFMHYDDIDADKPEPITVFGQAKEGLFYNYSDRLFGEDWNRGWKAAEAAGLELSTAHFFEAVLNVFHDSTDVDLQHVMLGVNRSNGFHYLVFGYTYTSKSKR